MGKKAEERDTRFSASYDRLQAYTGLSRAKIAAGLRLLEEFGVVDVVRNGRNNWYELPGITEDGKWAQLPQSHLFKGGTLDPFSKFQLRHRNELNALKIYMLLLAYRNARTNLASIGYEKICDAARLGRNDIPPALLVLIHHDLVRFDQRDPFDEDDVINGQPNGRPHNRYRIRGLKWQK